MIARIDPIKAQLEPELNAARRAFPKSQELLGGSAITTAAESIRVAWHDTEVHPEIGAFAVVRRDGDLSALVGEIIQVTRRRPQLSESCFVYVIDYAQEIERDISLARRAFLALGILPNQYLDCRVEVIG